MRGGAGLPVQGMQESRAMPLPARSVGDPEQDKEMRHPRRPPSRRQQGVAVQAAQHRKEQAQGLGAQAQKGKDPAQERWAMLDQGAGDDPAIDEPAMDRLA